MQKKWTDQPATDTDEVLNLIVLFAGTVLRRHASLLTKVLPPAIGFGIFLVYFARHQFYPSFDLFQFSSLLLAAACLGFGVVGIFVAVLFVPGAWIYHNFLNSKAIKEDISYALPYQEEPRIRKVFLLMGLAFFLPYLLSAIAMIAGAIMLTSMFLWVVFLVPIPIALLAGLAIQHFFELGRFSFGKYLWSAYFPSVASGFLIFSMWVKAYPAVEQWPWLGKWAVLIAVAPVIAGIASLCGMLFIAGWRAALLFATFFALMMAGFSGALTTLPDTVVNTLGLGNYHAKAIVLDPAYCEGSLTGPLLISPGCLLEEVHVIWSFGDALTLRFEDGSTAWLPAAALRMVTK